MENIITTQDELFKASIAEKRNDNPATKEVMHYKDALWHGVEQIEKRPILIPNFFVTLMQISKENQACPSRSLDLELLPAALPAKYS